MTYTISKKIMGFFFALCMVGSSFSMPIQAKEADYTSFGDIEIQDNEGNIVGDEAEAKTSDVFTMNIKDITFDDDEDTLTISVPDELKLAGGAQLKDEDGNAVGTASVGANKITVTKPDTEKEESSEDNDQDDKEDITDDEDEVSEDEDQNDYKEDTDNEEDAQYDYDDETEYEDTVGKAHDANSVKVKSVNYRSNEMKEDGDAAYTLSVPFYVTADVTLGGSRLNYKKETTTIKGQIKWENDSKSDRPNHVNLKVKNDKNDEEKSVKVKGPDWKFTLKDLSKYDADIHPISYSLDEDSISVDGYTKKIDQNEYTITMTKDSKEEKASTYKIETKADSNGTIDASATVESGKEKTIHYKADDGYEVDTVTVNGKTVDDKSGSYTFKNVTEDQTIEVTFKKKESKIYNITTSAGFNGTIDGSTTVESGREKTIHYKADDGYEVDTVTVNGKAVGNKSDSYTFKNVTEDQTIEVTFREIPTEKVRTSTLSRYSIVYKAKFSRYYHLDNDCTSFNVAKTYITSLTLEDALKQGLKPCKKEFIYDGYSFEVPVVEKKYKVETVTVSGTKTWNDNNNSSKKRPDSIVIYLYYGKGSDDRIAYVIKGTGNTWSYSFTGLPKYDSNGKEVEYAIREQALSYYDGTVKGYDLTNTYNGNAKKGTVRVDTGEKTNAGMYIGLLVVAAAGVVIVVWRKKSSK